MAAEEVSAIDMRRCRLAVLSACSTGLGRTSSGEGVHGLPAAFHQAGCRTVVASLWKVDDAATALLMSRFYKGLWEQKLPPIEALRLAQLALLNDKRYESPRFWAAWTSGAGGDLGPRRAGAGARRRTGGLPPCS